MSSASRYPAYQAHTQVQRKSTALRVPADTRDGWWALSSLGLFLPPTRPVSAPPDSISQCGQTTGAKGVGGTPKFSAGWWQEWAVSRQLKRGQLVRASLLTCRVYTNLWWSVSGPNCTVGRPAAARGLVSPHPAPGAEARGWCSWALFSKFTATDTESGPQPSSTRPRLPRPQAVMTRQPVPVTPTSAPNLRPRHLMHLPVPISLERA